jgi:hypothetical protein
LFKVCFFEKRNVETTDQCYFMPKMLARKNTVETTKGRSKGAVGADQYAQESMLH